MFEVLEIASRAVAHGRRSFTEGGSEVERGAEPDLLVGVAAHAEVIRRRPSPEVWSARETVVVRFDEVYETTKVTARSKFEDAYTASDSGVQFHTVVSDVQASGVLGFLYRRFGSRNMGKAFLSSQKQYLESTQR